MPNFDIYRGMITAFEVDDIYLFKLYFDQGDIFGTSEYYIDDIYRFKVPDDSVGEVRQILDEHVYVLRIKDCLESYSVINQKDTKCSGIQNQRTNEPPQRLHYYPDARPVTRWAGTQIWVTPLPEGGINVEL